MLTKLTFIFHSFFVSSTCMYDVHFLRINQKVSADVPKVRCTVRDGSAEVLASIRNENEKTKFTIFKFSGHPKQTLPRTPKTFL